MTCSEPLVWTCNSCGHSFQLDEWQEQGRLCPACNAREGSWSCGKCRGEFTQPSLGSEHSCLANSTKGQPMRLVSKTQSYTAPPRKAHSTPPLLAESIPNQPTTSRKVLGWPALVLLLVGLGILGLVINIMITQVQNEKDEELTKLYFSEQDRTLERMGILSEEEKKYLVSYDRGGDVFLGTMTQVVKLAMKAVQALGWKVDQLNEDLGLVSFTTGITTGSWSGVSGTISIKEQPSGVFKVTGTGKQNLAGSQIIAFDIGNEAQGKAMSVISKMKEFAGANKSDTKTTQAEPSVQWERSNERDSAGFFQLLLFFTDCRPQGNVSIPVVPDLELKKREIHDPVFDERLHGAHGLANVNGKFILAFNVRTQGNGPITIPSFEVRTKEGTEIVPSFTFTCPDKISTPRAPVIPRRIVSSTLPVTSSSSAELPKDSSSFKKSENDAIESVLPPDYSRTGQETDWDRECKGGWWPSSTEVGRYKLDFYQKVGRTWDDVTMTYGGRLQAGRVVIKFRIQPDGSVADLRVTQGDADSMLAQVVRPILAKSIGQSGPFWSELKKECPDGFEWQLAFRID